jgi:MOSC domain-containing protein YiiM
MQHEILKQFDLEPSDLGENITTHGIDLLALSKGTKLHFLPAGRGSDIKAAGAHPVVVITGLRNPCPQIEKFRKGLQEKFIVRDANRNIVVRKAGVMSVVEVGGKVDKGMSLFIETPATFVALDCVWIECQPYGEMQQFPWEVGPFYHE